MQPECVPNHVDDECVVGGDARCVYDNTGADEKPIGNTCVHDYDGMAATMMAILATTVDDDADGVETDDCEWVCDGGGDRDADKN